MSARPGRRRRGSSASSASSARPTARAKATGVAALLSAPQQVEGLDDALPAAPSRRDCRARARNRLRPPPSGAARRSPRASGCRRARSRRNRGRAARRAAPPPPASPRCRARPRRRARAIRGFVLDRLEHRRGHRENAGIAAGDDRDRAALRGQRQRETRAVELDAVVAGVSALVRPQRRAARHKGA